MADSKMLIDANALFRRLNSFIATAIHRGIDNIPMGKDSSSAVEYLKGYERGAIDSANLALGQPTVDAVEVVHGRWRVSRESEISKTVWCTACGEEFYLHKKNTVHIDKMPYCPNCGAKMDGDGNG